MALNNNPVELSLCLLAMPGEKKLAERLHRVKNIADEVIIADIGGDADALYAAQCEGATLLHVPWTGSFSSIKNFCMEHATGRWILFLHQNEYFEPEGDLRKLLKNPNAEGYIVFAPYRNNGVSSPVQSIRLLRNRKRYRFEYRSFEKIPEAVLADLLDSHLTISSVDVSADTWEHQTRTALLQKELSQAPNNGYLAYLAGLECINSGNIAKSMDYFQKSLDARCSESLYAPHLYKCFAWSLLYLGRNIEAIDLVNQGIKTFPFYSDLLTIRAELFRASGKHIEAARDLQSCISVLEQPSIFVPGPEICKSDVLEMLGDLYTETGNANQALACYAHAYELSPENPEYLQGVLNSPLCTDAAHLLEVLLHAFLKTKQPVPTAILADGLLQRREYALLWKHIEEIQSVLGDTPAFRRISLSCRMMLEELPDDCFVEKQNPQYCDDLFIRIRNGWYHEKQQDAENRLGELESCPEIPEPVKTAYRCIHTLLNGEDCPAETTADWETIAKIYDDLLWLGQEQSAQKLLPLLLRRADDDQRIRLAEGWAKQNHFAQIRMIFHRITDQTKKEMFRQRIALLLLRGNHVQTARWTLLLGGSPLCGEVDAVLRAEQFMRKCCWKIDCIWGKTHAQTIPRTPFQTNVNLSHFYCCLHGSKDNAVMTNAQLHEEIGNGYAEAKQWAPALTAYLRALQWEPMNRTLQQNVVALLQQNRTLLRAVRKTAWVAEGAFFDCPQDFFRFVYGMIFFQKRQYERALVFFSQKTSSNRCSVLFSAYQTSILWLQKQWIHPKLRKDSPDSAEMLLAACKSAALNLLQRYKTSFQYRDLLDFEEEKILNIFSCNHAYNPPD